MTPYQILLDLPERNQELALRLAELEQINQRLRDQHETLKAQLLVQAASRKAFLEAYRQRLPRERGNIK